MCLEPDPDFSTVLNESLCDPSLGCTYQVSNCTLQGLSAEKQFNAIIYIDVLEHIKDDRTELTEAAAHLRPGGFLAVLAPAHQWLFAPFDAAIGHYRRYNRSMLQKISPPGMRIEKLIYLDSVGLLASLANRLLLRQSVPKVAQLEFWDRRMIPASRGLDRLLRYSLGKTVLAIWQRV
jgi:hypothetical protein